ncbi:alpha-amylase family protein [Paenibacillus sp. P36]|uniref:alpha-amylase family protein n=1 Tax=Paenibacillus sp. P36 TaxID=3342538 RepID=UPI0038B3E2CF
MVENVINWLDKPQRIIQTNLQIKDTHFINPRKLASQMKEMGATALVFNVGGIYAWYPSKIDGHKVNEYLPQDSDLLKEVIEACHEQDIRFIARLDFSKTEDVVYLRKPNWFVRQPSGLPEIIGAERPGNWSLLMSTCLNSGYRNEDVAIPVLEEVLSHYDVDGIFFNAPHYVPCYCEICKDKYRNRYGVEIPLDRNLFAVDWPSSCIRDNMEKMYKFIKRKSPEVPMILYYNLYKDNLYARMETTDILCTEPQDILSEGHHRIPEFWKPALSIKLGRSIPDNPPPLGIVHSSPGMEWRHTGLPPAEYRFWLAQITSHGGSIWHSLTGIPDTITDKRIIETVTEFNRNVSKVEMYMDKAQTLAQVALMWTADAAAEGWADGLINCQIPFDVLLQEQATSERLTRYKALILPEGMKVTDDFTAILSKFVEEGGHLISEGEVSEQPELRKLLGIVGRSSVSEYLTAAYLRFEGANNPLQVGMEDTELIPHRGKVHYTKPSNAKSSVLATLVPPFSPLESVGAPPERASLPVSHTDIPLCIHHGSGLGSSVYLTFSLSALINEYKLGEHYELVSNIMNIALGEDKMVEVTKYHGLQMSMFEKSGQWLIHLVNGVGRRPLATNIPLHNIEIKMALRGRKIADVRPLISGESIAYEVKGNHLVLKLPKLDIWECLLIEFQ